MPRMGAGLSLSMPLPLDGTKVQGLCLYLESSVAQTNGYFQLFDFLFLISKPTAQSLPRRRHFLSCTFPWVVLGAWGSPGVLQLSA